MNTTLDQWEVLDTVVQSGSFAAAAARMNRSQSTISYTISRLQEQFNVPLLEMRGRRAQLTEAGKTLLARVQPLLTGFRALEEEACPATGAKMQLNVSVDSLFPNDRLFSSLSKLTRLYSYVHPQIHSTPFITSAYEFMQCGADVCITGFPARELFVKPLMDIRIKAVARVDHPLRIMDRELTRSDLMQHLAVIIEGTTGPEPRRQPHSVSQPHVVVNTIDSAIQAVCSGMCFGWLPVYRIPDLLKSGELAVLNLPLGGERSVRLSVVLKEIDPRNIEKNALAELLGANHELEML